MTKELKPCPFCGGKASYDTNGKTVWIICCACGVRTQGRYLDMPNPKQYVADLWNRRAKYEQMDV